MTTALIRYIYTILLKKYILKFFEINSKEYIKKKKIVLNKIP
jgi:hypothetical protein